MTTKYPYHERLAFNLLSICLIGLIIYLGQDILLPLFFSVLLSSLLLPVVSFLERKRMMKSIAIFITVAAAVLIGLATIYFLANQAAHFFGDFKEIKQQLASLFSKIQRWLSSTLNIGIRTQNQYIAETTGQMKESSPQLVGSTFLSLTQVLTYLGLVPIYTFLLLYYKPLIGKFITSLFPNGSKSSVLKIVTECQVISRSYLSGLFFDFVIVFALNTLGFVILGIKYAVFLALVAALLNLVPYVGMLIANVFCMAITLITSGSSADVLWVAAILAIVQLIDNNILIPWVVGRKVRINAITTIVAVLVGGAMCGVPGMFLAIPGVAVLKVVFDNVESLKPWGLIMGHSKD